MDAAFSIQGHPTTDTLEEYAFSRLSEADTEVVEEHFLACPECQTALAGVDEYILLMKYAMAQSDPGQGLQAGTEQSAGLGMAASAAQVRPKRAFTYSTVLLAAAAGIVLLLAFGSLWRTIIRGVPGWARGGPKLERYTPELVQLLALRGAVTNRAHARWPLDLNIDLTEVTPDLPPPSTGTREPERYRVEVVDAAGGAVWNGETAGAQGSLSVHLANGLEPGQYWVRLYLSGKLVREFGLRTE
jgi:hypothetical protein